MAALKDKLNIRIVNSRDYDTIFEIEELSFDFPWSRKELEKTIRDVDTMCYIGEVEGEVLCYIIYHNYEKYIDVFNLAVHPRYRRRGLGTKLISILKKKLSPDRKIFFQMMIRESNLLGQVFLRSVGMKAMKTLKNQYDETEDDAYMFRYGLKDDNSKK